MFHKDIGKFFKSAVLDQFYEGSQLLNRYEKLLLIDQQLFFGLTQLINIDNVHPAVRLHDHIRQKIDDSECVQRSVPQICHYIAVPVYEGIILGKKFADLIALFKELA